ncbi:dodecin domain-containing protein [Methylobacterium oryzisoli]|uniref:dodecin domain-containing protein n=1 Tax=Methylobacterium oryzisoli TaxID=3385502 RepID=UPI0038918238
MAMVEFIERSARSPQSYGEAIEQAAEMAPSTQRNMPPAWLNECEVIAGNDRIAGFG